MGEKNSKLRVLKKNLNKTPKSFGDHHGIMLETLYENH